MKLGFTHDEAIDLYMDLHLKAWKIMDMPSSYFVPARVGGESPQALASTQFADPNMPWRTVEQAQEICINADLLPHIYEDELIDVLMHELAHATAGFSAMHGFRWAEHAKMLGSTPSPEFIIRNWESVEWMKQAAWLFPLNPTFPPI